MAHSGSLFVFEGPDGVGKTTLVRRTAEALQSDGRRVDVLSFPGREPGTLGEHVYSLHHDPAKFGITAMTPESLQVLHVAAHLDAIDRLIRPRLESGSVVLLDRYWWSTWVYGISGGGRRATLDAAIASEVTHWGALRPSALLLISRSESLRVDEQRSRWLTRVGLYRDLAEMERGKYPIYTIPNNREPEQATEMILQTIGHHWDAEAR